MKQYHTVLADPPWNERGGGQSVRGAQRHYHLLKTKEIIEIMRRVPYAENCHLYLWATVNKLPDALKVIEAVGFRYVRQYQWVKCHIERQADNWLRIKPQIGMGQYARGVHETLLFATRGRLPYKSAESDIRSKCGQIDAIFAPRREHSQKPDEQYEIIEKTSYPPFLEMFARTSREGWDVFGDESEDSITLGASRQRTLEAPEC